MSESAEKQAGELAQTIRFFYGKGWCPASSCDFSFRNENENGFRISKPGIDKGLFEKDALVHVNTDGHLIKEKGAQPSPETTIHAWLYRHENAGAVFQTQSISNTVVSLAYEKERGFWLQGYELLKGIDGIKSHLSRIFVPIFPNSQDMKTLCAEITMYARENKEIPAFLIAGHGLYCWGKSIAEAKRHTEVFEFLFECHLKLRMLG
jgi:methylthioribulose-1-phosphate dehydratase